MSARALRCALAITLLPPPFALAQVSGSASLLSDYRFRGVSLSDEKPAVQLGLAYDDPSGIYGGVFASSTAFRFTSGRGLQLVSYLGYAHRLPSGAAWEAGAEYASFTTPNGWDYPEAYVGAAWRDVSARSYYAPRYFGVDSDTLYAELNATRPLVAGMQLLAHAGLLRYTTREFYPGYVEYVRRSRWDARLGVGTELQAFSVQLSWVAREAESTGYTVGERHRNTVLLSVSRAF